MFFFINILKIFIALLHLSTSRPASQGPHNIRRAQLCVYVCVLCVSVFTCVGECLGVSGFCVCVLIGLEGGGAGFKDGARSVRGPAGDLEDIPPL